MSIFTSLMRAATVAIGGGGEAPFPYEQGSELIPSFTNPVWKCFSASHTQSHDPYTIFSHDKTKSDPATLLLAKNALQKIKTLRHPCILKYIDSQETATHINIATECCTPFRHDFDRNDKKKGMAMALGLYQVLSAISWLNNDCKLVHGSLCPAAVYVVKSGEYRLFGLDLTYKHGDTSAAVNVSTLTPSQRCSVLPPVYRSPELSKATSSAYFTTIEQDPNNPTPIHYLDAWSLGVLIFDLFSAGTLSSPTQLANKDIIPASLQTEYKRLLATNPIGRLNPKIVLDAKFFTESPLIQTLNFLNEYALQNNENKEKFFTHFVKQINHFPDSINKYKFLPQLIQILAFGGTVGSSSFSSVLTAVLKIGHELDVNEYNTTILPPVVKLFSSNERAVRLHLLSALDQYAAHLTSDVINDQIFPHVCTGFSDTQPVLREITVKSMTHFMPHLNAAQTQVALRHLAKTQSDAEPAIRTNTTYCIAKMANCLSPANKELVLIPAFTRALKDPFPPARIAGLVALTATLPEYSSRDIAKRVIPACSVCCVDDAGEVRENALRALNAMMQRLQVYHNEGGQDRPRVTADGTAAGGKANDSSTAAVSDAASAATALLANASSWAVSSFSKLYGATTNGSITADTQANKTAANTPTAASTAQQAMGSAAPNAVATATAPAPISSTAAAAAAASTAVVDGWDDDFNLQDLDNGNNEDDDDFSTAAVLTSKVNKQQQPQQQKREEHKERVGSGSNRDKDNTSSNKQKKSILSIEPGTPAESTTPSKSLDDWDAWGDNINITTSSNASSVDTSAFDPFSTTTASNTNTSTSTTPTKTTPTPAKPIQTTPSKKPGLISPPPISSPAPLVAAPPKLPASKSATLPKPGSTKGKKDADDWAAFLND